MWSAATPGPALHIASIFISYGRDDTNSGVTQLMEMTAGRLTREEQPAAPEKKSGFDWRSAPGQVLGAFAEGKKRAAESRTVPPPLPAQPPAPQAPALAQIIPGAWQI